MKNKKGISLIVLVITIIVIIILAAAVILTLTDNNPISNAKAASIAQNKDSVESGINLYVAQKIAATQGTFTNEQIVMGSIAGVGTEPILKDGTTAMAIVGAKSLDANITGYCPIISGSMSSKVGMALPTPPANSNWYLDPNTNKVYLVFTKAAGVPAWLSTFDFVKELAV